MSNNTNEIIKENLYEELEGKTLQELALLLSDGGVKLLSQFTGCEGGGDFVEYAKELVVNEQFEELEVCF
tara:strand:+ start:86 stop:295 length:210 start_codon:yes stop_codon:yes gene_type:complete